MSNIANNVLAWYPTRLYYEKLKSCSMLAVSWEYSFHMDWVVSMDKILFLQGLDLIELSIITLMKIKLLSYVTELFLWGMNLLLCPRYFFIVILPPLIYAFIIFYKSECVKLILFFEKDVTNPYYHQKKSSPLRYSCRTYKISWLYFLCQYYCSPHGLRELQIYLLL